MSNELARFAAMTRAGRKAKEWTQEQLATAADISSESVSNIERAKFAPTFDVLVAIVASLELDPAAIFTVDKRSKKPTAQRLDEEASLAMIIRDLDDGRVGLILDIAKAVRDRADVGGRKKA